MHSLTVCATNDIKNIVLLFRKNKQIKKNVKLQFCFQDNVIVYLVFSNIYRSTECALKINTLFRFEVNVSSNNQS